MTHFSHELYASVISSHFRVRPACVTIEALTDTQAETAAHLWQETQPLGLSLPGHACLALAIDKSLPVLTIDRVWHQLKLTLAVRVVRYGKCSAATGRTDRVERWRKTLHCITDGKRASEETQRDSNVTIKPLETPFPAGKADTRCLPDEQAPLVTQGTRASVVTESSASRTSPLSRIRVSTDGLRTKCLFLRKLGRDAHRSNLLIHARQRQACQANALFVHTLVKNQGWNTPFTYILLQYPALLPLFLVTHIDLFSFISKR